MVSKVVLRLIAPLLILCTHFFFLNAQPFWERDAGFGANGTVRIGGGREDETVRSLALLPGGKILAAGRYAGDLSFIMARYHPNGQLDASFGTNGKTAFHLGRNYGEAKEILLFPDGRFILGASSGEAPGIKEVFSLVRFLPDGSPDGTFGTNGVAKGASSPDLFDKLNAIVLQPDGKIVAAGSTNYINGPDSLQSVTLIRFNADGGIDNTFGINGVVRLPYPDQYYEFNAVTVQADGRIIAAGSNFDKIIVARFEPNGSPDNTFGANGVQFLQYSAAGKTRCRAISLLPNGKILLGGWCYDYWFNNGAVAIRLLSDGSPDPDFGIGISGMAFIHCDYQLNTSSMTLQNDGKIVLAAAGLNNDPWPTTGIFRFLPDGTPDSSFAQYGEWVSAVGNENSALHAVHATPDGKILAGGVSKKYLDCDFTLLRLQNDGTPDPAFGDNGLVITDFGWGYDWPVSVHQRPDGKVLYAGKAYASGTLVVQDKCLLSQFLADGTPDTGFGNGGRDTFPCGDLKTVILQQDGKILAGTDSYWDGYVRPVSIFRRLPNGGPDSAFGQFGQVDSLFGNYFAPIVIQAGVLSNGKIVVAGRVSRPGTNRDFILTCLNTDGSRDLSFGDNGFVLVDFNNKNDEVYGLAVQSDDKIVLSGIALSGSPAKQDVVVMRFHPDGTFDNTWGQNGILLDDFEAPVGEGISYMTFTPEGKLLLAVQCQITIDTSYEDAVFENVFACYNTDGSPDISFGNSGKVVIPINAPFAGSRYIRQIRFFPNGKFITAELLPPVSMNFDSFTIELKRYLPDGSADTFPAAHAFISDQWGNFFGLLAIEMLPAEGIVWLAGSTYFDYQLNEDVILARFRFEPGCFPVSVQSVTGTGLDDTNVNISPSVSCPAMTLLTGCDDETLCLCGKEAVVVAPHKNDNPLNGVSTYDLVLISRHIIGLGTFASPYQLIAADANRSGSVTTFDIVEIRKLILGIYQNFPNNTSWRFIRKEYNFPNPANPFNPTIPEKDTVSALDPPARLAYVAVKTGDVNGSHLTGCDNFNAPEPRQSLALNAAMCPAATGSLLTVPVFFAENADCAAWQCALRFDDAALELVSVQPGEFEGMDANNIGLTDAGRGVLRALWHSEDGSERRVDAGKILYRLVFRAKKDIAAGEAYLSVNEEALASRAYRADGEAITLTLDNKAHTCATAASFGIRVSPNPVSTSVCFKIENSGGRKGVLRIFNAHGAMCFQQTVTCTESAGYCFSEVVAWPPGLYSWRFTGDNGETGEGKFLKQ
jgi:uncharacterized delta-60 repeat protein